MGKKQVEQYLDKALKESAKLVDNKKGGIESKYFTGIANFGVAVLQSGIKATEFYFSEKGKPDRHKILNAVKAILDVKHLADADKPRVLDAVTALKLAARTFNKLDNDGGD